MNICMWIWHKMWCLYSCVHMIIFFAYWQSEIRVCVRVCIWYFMHVKLVNIHTYISAILTCMCVCVCMDVMVCMLYVCMYVHTGMCMCVHASVQVCMLYLFAKYVLTKVRYLCACESMCVSVCVCVCECVCECVNVYNSIYCVYIHMYTCINT